MSDILQNAVLSIDSYNRGVDEGIDTISGPIGNYSLILQSDITTNSEEVQKSFYAAAYKNNATGEIIISYRGTDSTTDISNGWLLGGGNIQVSQARLAVEFYRDVVTNEYGSASNTNLLNANITLTGHSLGGGLAGYVAALYGKEAYIYDSMNYISAVAETVAQSNNYANASTAVQNLIVAIYNGTTTWPVNTSNIHGYQIDGQALDGMYGASGQQTYDVGTGIDLSDLGAVDRHDAALLAMRIYASSLSSSNWQGSAEKFIPVLFNDDFAEDIGVGGKTGELQDDNEYSQILRTIIAYSATAEGERPFGDTAIRSFYDDANDLGLALAKTGGASSFLIASATDISKAFIQYAALQALNDKESPNQQNGILTALGTGSDYSLTVDFSNQTWVQATDTPAAILTKQAIIDSILSYDMIASPQITAAMSSAWGNSTYTIFDRVGYSLGNGAAKDFSSLSVTSGKSTLITGGNSTDVIIGTAGNDLILGWDGTDTASYEKNSSAIDLNWNGTHYLVTDTSGIKDVLYRVENITGSGFNDTLRGRVGINETLSGNAGNDTFYGYDNGTTLDADTFAGGAGIDTANYSNLTKSVVVNSDNVQIRNTSTNNILSGVENVTLTAYDDTFNASYTGVSAIRHIDGGNGNNIFGAAGGTYDPETDTITDLYGKVVYDVSNFQTLNYDYLDLSYYNSPATTHIWRASDGPVGEQYISVGGKNILFSAPNSFYSGMRIIHGTHNGDTLDNFYNFRNVTSDAPRENAALAYILGLGNDTINLGGFEDDTAFVYTGGNDIFQSVAGNSFLTSGIDTLVLLNVNAADVTYTINNVINSPENGQQILDWTLNVAGKGTIQLKNFAFEAPSGLAYNDALNKIYVNGGFLSIDRTAGAFSGLSFHAGGHPYDSQFKLKRNGDDIINGSVIADIITSMFGDDIVDGKDGNDNIYASGGNDTLIGGAGADNLYGGDGGDTYSFNTGFVTGTQKDYVEEAIDVEIDTIGFGSGLSVANINMWGGNGGSYFISFDGTNSNIEVYAEGNETDLASRVERITFSGGPTWNLTTGLILTDTNTGHTTTGSASGDTINGRGGNDLIYGFGGNDTLEGGQGNDTVSGGEGNDILVYRYADKLTSQDIYTGDGGTDELKLYFTTAEFSNAIRDSLAAYDLQLKAGTVGSSSYSLPLLNLNVSTVETLSVYVNNVLYDLNPGTNPSVPGLVASHYTLSSSVSSLSQVNFLVPPNRTEVVTSVNKSGSDAFYAGGPTDNFAVSYNGYLKVTTAGTYTISLNSDDGSALWLDGTKVIDNDGLHGSQQITYTQSLTAGNHALKLNYFEAGGGQVVQLYWNGPDTNSQNVIIGSGGLLYAPSQLANSIPVATDDTAATVKNIPVTISVLGNDTDFNGDTLSISALTQGAHGAAVLNANGTITYTPATNYVGSDAFTYTVSDGHGGTDVANVNVTIGAALSGGLIASYHNANVSSLSQVNFAATPIYTEIVNSINKNGPATTPFYTNGPIDNFAVSYNGYLHINAAGTYTFSLNSDDGSELWLDGTKVINNDGLHGAQIVSSTLTLTAGDHALKLNYFESSGDQTVQLFWNGPDSNGQTSIISGAALLNPTPNTPPTVVNDAASINKDVATVLNVLKNDTDLNGDALTVSAVTQGAHGTVTINANRTVTYTPVAGYTGSDTFTYTTDDGHSGTNVGTVTLTIAAGTILGTSANNTLTGGAEANHIYGYAGNDTLTGGAGFDVLYGGANDDSYVFAPGFGGAAVLGPDQIYENINEGNDWINMPTVNGGGFRMWVDENQDLHIRLVGSAADEILVLGETAAGGGTDVISRIEGINYNGGWIPTYYELNLGDTDDSHTMHGAATNDILNGFGGDDIIYGFGGNDLLIGDQGADELHGGVGNDTVRGGFGNDLLYGDAGADDVYGDEGNDTLVDGADRDNLYGGAGNDTYILASGLGVATTLGPDMIYEDINGGGLDIIKILGSGSDIRIWVDASEDLHIRFLANPNDEYVVNGEAVATGGTDVVSRIERIVYNNGQLDTSYSLNLFDTDDGHVIHGSAGGDTIDGLGGNDVIYGFDGSDILVGSAGNDELRGGNGNDLLEAGADNDVLYGDAGDDSLYGHGGNDILAVSDGTDTLYGDIGSDTFWFNLLNTGIDTIADFKIAENDKIDISDILQGYNPLNHAISDFVEITTSGANSILKVDVNGGANSFAQIATITGVTGLTDEAALVTSGNLIAA